MAAKNGDNRCQQPNAPHFFQPIVLPLDRGIRIPSAFMSKHGHLLSEIMFMKVPTGASWEVELLQTNDGTWLHKGWLGFAKFYGVDLGHLLVFRCDGNSQFYVTIFNPSSTEIEYPLERNHFGHEEDNPVKGETGKVPEPKEIKTGDENEKFFRKAPASSSSVKTRGRLTGTEKIDSGVQIDQENPQVPYPDVNSRHYHLRRRTRSNQLEHSPEVTRIPDSPHQQPANATGAPELNENYDSYLRAKAFKSENPFFVRRIHHSHVNAPFQMAFSLAFARDNLPEGRSWDLMFTVKNSEQCWPVRCFLYSDRVLCKLGWKQFVQANDLLVGDVCVFELMKDIMMFTTVIYRNS